MLSKLCENHSPSSKGAVTMSEPKLDEDDIFSLLPEGIATSIASLCGKLGADRCTCFELGDMVRKARGLPQFRPNGAMTLQRAYPTDHSTCTAGHSKGDVTHPAVMTSRGPAGMDPCIASIVVALNLAGIKTLNSCCGHGKGPGGVILADGREVFVVDRDTPTPWRWRVSHWNIRSHAAAEEGAIDGE